uniref:Uncharacterized protein n=1 Tax=Rhizophora mucronata TaxID=61149 RepID=A0A2P2JCV3_RHIMU
MLVAIDSSTRIARVYNNHANSVLICQRFDCFKINLPTIFRQQVKMANVKMTLSSTGFVVRETWSRKQNVGTRSGKGLQ